MPVMLESNQPSQPQLILVMGADGSGKSTIVTQLAAAGYHSLEPTTSPEAVAFRHDNYQKPLTRKLVDERQKLYLKLNHQFDEQVHGLLALGDNVVTTGHELVTYVYHEVMRGVIDGTYVPRFPVNEWLDAGVVRPTTIVILYTPLEVLEERLQARLNADPTEALIGFNSLTFLEAFQHTLLQLRQPLTDLGISCGTYDTSTMSPTAIVEQMNR